MEPTHQVSLTPEQLAAITAGGGFAQCEDPVTHVQYQLIQVDPSAVDDDYIREKIAEAQDDVDNGNIAEWNLNEIKQKLHARLAEIRARE